VTCMGKKKTGVGLGTAIGERGRAARSCSLVATGSGDAAVVDGGEERAHRGREVRGGVARAKAVGGAQGLAVSQVCFCTTREHIFIFGVWNYPFSVGKAVSPFIVFFHGIEVIMYLPTLCVYT
jgi:hypothetical protein